MRGQAIITIAAGAMIAACLNSGARAEEWCGYSRRDKSLIECGFTSLNACEKAVGKNGLCFVDPATAGTPRLRGLLKLAHRRAHK